MSEVSPEMPKVIASQAGPGPEGVDDYLSHFLHATYLIRAGKIEVSHIITEHNREERDFLVTKDSLDAVLPAWDRTLREY